MTRIRKIASTLMASLLALSAAGQSAPSRPRLVVGIMVEGLEQQQIDLLRHRFVAGGFNRLLNDGAVLENVDYGTNVDATAATAIIYTGAAPSTNGIPAAEIFDRATRRGVAVLTDEGAMGNYTNQTFSPRSLAVSTIADEAVMGGAGVTYAYAIAPEPAQAVIMAGHAGSAGIWLNDATANWATSTYYHEAPSPMTRSNRHTPLRARMDTMQWTPLLAADNYPLLPDHITRYPFRYVFRPAGPDKMAMLKNSPMINAEVTALAIDHINTLSLGQHPDGSDMLSLAYTVEPLTFAKSTDNRFEQQDAYYRLDRNLEQLFSTIDRNIGLDNALIFLAATPPSGRSRRDDEKWQLPYGEFSARRAVSLLNMYLMAIHGNGEWVSGYHNGQFFLNHKLINDRNIDLATIRNQSAACLKRMAGIAEAFALEDIMAVEAGRDAEALRRNTSVATAGDVLVQVMPGWQIVDENAVGNERPNQVVRYGAPSAPVYILGADVKARTIDTPVDARAIAPTVCRLARIRSPNGAALAPLNLQK